MNYAPAGSFGNTYIPTYRNYDLDDDNLKLELSRDYIAIANALNLKTNGIYETVETQDGEQFFGNPTTQNTKRYVFRKCYTFGAIAAGATISPLIPTGITGVTIFTRIYGTCITDNPDYRPIPHASVTANANIEIYTDGTNITIKNGAGGPNITSGIVVLEYLKQ